MPNAFVPSSMNMGFQATISAATADSGNPTILPHHPITCQSKLYYNEDGSFSCEHATAPSDDSRTQRALIHSMATLIIELAYGFDGMDALGEPARIKPEE